MTAKSNKLAFALGVVIAMSMVLAVVPQQADAQEDAYTWYSYREDVSVIGYNATDLWENSTRDYGAWATDDENITGNFTLPAPISDATTMVWHVYNNDIDATKINLTWNGVVQGDNETVNAGVEWTGSVDEASHDESYVNWSFNASDGTEGHTFLNFSIHYENITITAAAWVTGSTYGFVKNIKERLKTDVEVGDSYRDSWYVVEDRITVNVTLADSTNNSIEIYDADLLLSYPNHALNTPSASVAYINSSGGSQNVDISYQKRGPYVSLFDHEVDGDEHTTTLQVKDFETNNDVTWTFDPTADPYIDYFPNLNYDTLEIKKFGTSIDWEKGSVDMEELRLATGLNTFTFTWTEAEEPTPVAPAEAAWYEETIGPMPVWVALAIIIIAAIAVVMLAVVPSRKNS